MSSEWKKAQLSIIAATAFIIVYWKLWGRGARR